MHNKEVILVWLPAIGLFGHTYLSGLASQPSPLTQLERRREGPLSATKCHRGAWLPACGAGSSEHLLLDGQASLFRDLYPMHTPVLPIPLLWAQVSAPSSGIKKEQDVTHACAGVSSLPAAGVPAEEGLLSGVHATHPATAAPRPTAGLRLGALAHLSGSQLQKMFVARCDGWWIPLKCQETDVQALGLS